MSTPSFNSTSQSFTQVRLYTELDPYYYTIDNRPLQDLQTNSSSLASAADAGRRGVLIENMKDAAVFAGMFSANQSVVGLRATVASSSTVSVTPGALMVPGPISASDSRQILRTAASSMTTVLNTPAPVTLGQEMTYIVQVGFTEFTNSSTYPNFDSANVYLQSNILNGYATVSVVAGAQANTGTSVAPSVTPGYVPLYTVVSVSGASPVITLNAGSPNRLVQISNDEAWVTPTLGNSWVNVAGYQTLQYKRVGSKVIIRGAVQSGTAASVAFNLPAGFRPLSTNGFAASNGSTGSVWVTVASTGDVTIATSTTTHFGIVEFYVD